MKVRSSMLKEVEWKDDTLYVLFNTDEAYLYKKVPKGIYSKLIIAHKNGTSVGSFFDTFVKKAGYEYEKIDWHNVRLSGALPESPLDIYKRICAELEEDYPGQRREYIRQKAVENAVSAADRIIMDTTDGSVEELHYLTSQVALKFAEKVNIEAMSSLRTREIFERVKDQAREKVK